MRSRLPLLLTFCYLLRAIALAENWGQPDSEDKTDANPWMWGLRHDVYDSPEEAATAMAERRGVWSGIFSRFDKFDNKWERFEKVESTVLWQTADLAIVYGYADAFRTEMGAVWIILRFDELNGNWWLEDVLIRRDIGYSHVATQLFEKVKGINSPILFIDTYRGGRREGDQSYELYRIENALDPSSPSGGNDVRKPARFRRCLLLETRYCQRNSWRGEAEFSITETFEIKVGMLRENMFLNKQDRSTLQLNWKPERKEFDAETLEQFIGLEKLVTETQKTNKIR